MNITNHNIDIANARLIQRWNQPHPAFASGTDMRSSDQRLLELLYGGIERASRYQWLNGGRTLIDKTYLAIFWSAHALPTPYIGFEKLASNLDRFIRVELADRWDELAELDHEDRHQLTIELVNAASEQLFGSQADVVCASQLLLFLCPQLPVFGYNEANYQALKQRRPGRLHPTDQQPLSQGSYAQYHQAYRKLLAYHLPTLAARPLPTTPSATGSLGILLAQTDWWARRLLIQQTTCATDGVIANAQTNQTPTLGVDYRRSA